jgi:hypothetical protein|tara:strand:+ start:1387 stop:1650 length:264 start_codon:yes stop_codon:yes gene_type:complete
MNEFKGTKEEWKSKKSNTGSFVVIANGYYIGSFRKEHDAKIAAAAPELLNALLEIEKILKKEWPDTEWDDFANEETSFTKAINKALN